MKVKKLLLSVLLCTSVFLLSKANSKTTITYAETNSSEVVSTSSKTMEEKLDTAFGDEEWYVETKDIIKMGAEMATLAFTFMALGLTFTKKLRLSIKNLEVASEEKKAEAKRYNELSAKYNELNKQYEVQVAKNNELIDEVRGYRKDMTQIKEAMKVAFCNDKELVASGKAQIVENIFEDNKQD